MAQSPVAIPHANVETSEEEAPGAGENSHEIDEHEHSSQRAPWLRAMLMGALDGLMSTASVMLGVGGGTGDLRSMRLAGIAAGIAGALSMFLGEYASVAAQRDTEAADIKKERDMQAMGPEARAHELDELTQIYVNRGLCYSTAKQVAQQLTDKDVIRAHARDELGIDVEDLSNPLQAGVVDMVSFILGALVPVLCGSFIHDSNMRIVSVAAASVLACFILGFVSARLSGVKIAISTFRVTFFGTATLAATYLAAIGFSKLGVE
mmetsp:Transcript_22189/g.66185  ORF Transcript_22189/g.66185 Transcript_22189/m.66185 type:complete len:264 (-) Transcript_22189:177-968(-)